MMAYIILLLTITIASLLESTKIKQSQIKIVTYFTLCIIIFIVGFRYYTGSDWHDYIIAYNKIPQQGNYMNWEIGYVWLIYIFNWIGVDYHVMQATISCFLFVSVYITYKRHTDHPILILTLFLLMLFTEIVMAQVRQSIALAIIALGSKYIFDRKLIHFIITVIIACFFHVSAIVALPLYFMYSSWGKTIPIVLILISQISYFFPQFIFNIIRFITPFLPTRLADRTNIYINSSIFANGVEIRTGIYYLSTVLLAITIILLFTEKNKKISFFINCLTIACVLKSLSTNLEIINRVYSYYIFLGLVAYGYLLDIKISKISHTLTKNTITLLLIIYIAIPPIKAKTSNEIDTLTHRKCSYSYIPYYNYFIHNSKIALRKDWNEK